MILGVLESYARNLLGEDAWPSVLEETGLAEDRTFDAQVEAIVGVLARRTGRPERQIYQDVGEMMAPALLEKNRASIEPGWRTIDIIEHVKQSAYEMTYDRIDPDRPTQFKSRRQARDEVILIFSTPRSRTCGLADGIIHGIARGFGEQIEITHISCMQHGDPSCELIIRKIL